MQWQQQRCLLTGATGGIGQAIARRLADRGVTLILQGRDEVSLKRLQHALPGDHHILVGDLSTAQGRQMVEDAIPALLPVTMLINNAGVSAVGDLEHLAADDIERVMQTNLLAPMWLTQQLLPDLKQQSQAYIVNVGSTFGSIGFACHSLYCASKFGLRGFTEALHRELQDSSVHVMYLAPRATQTAINSEQVIGMNAALGNTMDPPAVVAEALIEQLSSLRARKFIGFPEKLFARINGAFPYLVDNALAKKLATIKRFAGQHSVESNL